MPLAYSYFPIESKKLDAQKCPRSNQINAHKECQSKIHQEYRALHLESGVLSSRNTILLFLCSAIQIHEQVASWVSPPLLDSKESAYPSLHVGIGFFRCLSVTKEPIQQEIP